MDDIRAGWLLVHSAIQEKLKIEVYNKLKSLPPEELKKMVCGILENNDLNTETISQSLGFEKPYYEALLEHLERLPWPTEFQQG